jgi:hypothetical protein
MRMTLSAARTLEIIEAASDEPINNLRVSDMAYPSHIGVQ